MERLISLMARDKVTQYRLAKQIGAPVTTVNGWFKGKATPREKYLSKICGFFHVHPAWLRYGDPQYAPTIETQAQMLAEDIAKYGPEGVKRARQMLKIFFTGEEGIRKDTAVYKKKESRRRKSA